MAIKLTQREFIEKAHTVHGNKYDYSESAYVSAHTKITIYCRGHGIFKQTARSHLNGRGCAKCANTLQLNNLTFTERARKIHGEKYDYSQIAYVNAKKKVTILCPLHGAFEQSASEHLYGSGCRKCIGTAQLTTSEFIERSKAHHGDRYNYSLVKYTRSTAQVTIICPNHGPYQQPATTHMNGAGCDMCARMENPWRASNWIAAQKGRTPLLYIIRLSNEAESFFKVGITFQSLDKRFRPSMMPYSFEEVAVFSAQNALDIHQTEMEIKKQFKAFSCRPRIAFGGQTECYSDVQPIIEFLTNQSTIRQIA